MTDLEKLKQDLTEQFELAKAENEINAHFQKYTDSEKHEIFLAKATGCQAEKNGIKYSLHGKGVQHNILSDNIKLFASRAEILRMYPVTVKTEDPASYWRV